MESNNNSGPIEAFCKEYSGKVCSDFFGKKEMIAGTEILTVTEIKQINLFVLREINETWIEEVDKLQSPYFNYKNTKVASSLASLMNTLSQNISVDKEHFEPLLYASVHKFLELLISPYQFYQGLFGSITANITDAHLQNLQKYVKVNPQILTELVAKFRASGSAEHSVDETLSLLDQVFEQAEFEPEELGSYAPILEKMAPLPSSVFEKELGAAIATEPIATAEAEVLTLNEKLASSLGETIADSHIKKPIQSIRKSLTINQKYMFVNDLFEGKNDDFNEVIDFLDGCESYQSAKGFLESNYLSKGNWKSDSREVVEFFNLVEKRFS